jgi:hypothetical protein
MTEHVASSANSDSLARILARSSSNTSCRSVATVCAPTIPMIHQHQQYRGQAKQASRYRPDRTINLPNKQAAIETNPHPTHCQAHCTQSIHDVWSALMQTVCQRVIVATDQQPAPRSSTRLPLNRRVFWCVSMYLANTLPCWRRWMTSQLLCVSLVSTLTYRIPQCGAGADGH